MVINPTMEFTFSRAKGLTSPEANATVVGVHIVLWYLDTPASSKAFDGDHSSSPTFVQQIIGYSPIPDSALHEMTPEIQSVPGLVPNPHPSTPLCTTSQTDWDILVSTLFDEFLNPSPVFIIIHPLENIIDELARPVSTRLQLHEQALFCYYDAFRTAVKPKTYKDALTQACRIEAMQEELNEFERLEVWELIPRLDKVMVITLK
ncbi:hypothetical protein Tco_0117897 [Tanacetum coccineum]